MCCLARACVGVLARTHEAYCTGIPVKLLKMTGTGKKTPGGAETRDTRGTQAHGSHRRTSQPSKPTNPPGHDLASTTESAAGSTAAAQEEEPNAPRGRLRRGRLQRTGKKTPGPVQYSLGPAILLLFNTTRVRRSSRSLLRCFVNTTRDHSPDPKAQEPRRSLCSCYRYSAKSPRRSIVWPTIGGLSIRAQPALCFKPLHTPTHRVACTSCALPKGVCYRLTTTLHLSSGTPRA